MRQAPTKVGSYSILRELGRGSFAAVYLALKANETRPVALKLLHKTANDKEILARFDREGELGSRLQHPGIVPVLDSGLDPRGPYLVLEYQEGGSLADRLGRGELSSEEAAEVMVSVARAVHAAHQAGTPLALVNARMSERSARRYARLGGFARQTFSELAGVAAQTGDDARRLADLGARGPVVSGSVKFDVSVPEESRVIRDGLRDRIGERPVVLAASTREGEEMSLVTAFLAAAPAAALLVVVPRHPQRFDEVAGWLAARQIPSQRRSAPEPVAPATRVLLGDSMGEMFAYYALADVSIIGGSWQPLGGQNLLEACAVGTPSIVGPHTFNFAEISAHAIKAGATLRAADAGDAVAKALALIDDDAHRQRMGAAGLAFCAAHRGATQRTLDILDQLTGAAH